MPCYINIHVHERHSKTCIEVINLFPENAEKIISGNPDLLFSVGLHPWYIGKNPEELIQEVEKLSFYKNVIAIGEVGLDKVCKTDFIKQTEVFKAQIRIAEKAEKALIIHCVKAFSEILEIKKECQVKVPMIFHGFRGNPVLAEQLLQHGCFLSLGEKSLQNTETIKAIPVEKLFMETDESKVPISKIYNAVAKIKNIPQQELVEQMQLNFAGLICNK
jgi:TatD DNase family protein